MLIFLVMIVSAKKISHSSREEIIMYKTMFRSEKLHGSMAANVGDTSLDSKAQRCSSETTAR